MEKETLLTGFNQRIGNPDANGMYESVGVSARTLDVYIDKILPTIADDTQVNDDFWNMHVDIIKTIGGQMRHEKAEFIKSYKPNTPPTPPTPPAQPESEFKQWLAKYEKEQKENKLQFAIKEMRLDVTGKAEELNVSNRNLWKDAVGMVEYKDKMTLDEMIDAAKKIYEKKLKDYMGDGATPYNGGNGMGNSGSIDGETAKNRRETFRKRMQAQGRLPEDEK